MVFTKKDVEEIEKITQAVIGIFNERNTPPVIAYAAVTIMRREMIKTDRRLHVFDDSIQELRAFDDDGNEIRSAWEKGHGGTIQ